MVVIDLETSGVNPADGSIIDVGYLQYDGTTLVKKYSHSCASLRLHYTMITIANLFKSSRYCSQNAEKCPFMGRSIT